jgi:hypothetical protein
MEIYTTPHQWYKNMMRYHTNTSIFQFQFQWKNDGIIYPLYENRENRIDGDAKIGFMKT